MRCNRVTHAATNRAVLVASAENMLVVFLLQKYRWWRIHGFSTYRRSHELLENVVSRTVACLLAKGTADCC